MSKTPFSNKVDVLGEFWLLYRDQAAEDQGWQDFIDWADVGLPMAYMAWQGMVTIKPDSKKYIEEAWDVFCEMLNVDPNGKYINMADLLDASPNAPLNTEGE
jgi:hypothetical protein